MKRTLLLIVVLICIPAYAGATTLFLDDWGVEPGDWTPTNAPSGVVMVTEDYAGSPTGFVDPGWGGQPFDAEAAYMAFANSKLYIGIVTGLPQEGSPDPWRYNNASYNYYDWNRELEKYWYDPGDIGLDLNADGSYEYAVTTRIDNDKSSYVPASGEGILLSGGLVWEDPKAWDYWSHTDDWGGASDPWVVKEYDNAVELEANFSYSRYGSDHYAIEAIIDVDLFDMAEAEVLAMHWVMECGNDAIDMSAEIPSSVPEPSTVILLGFGLAGIGIYKRKKKCRGNLN